ncbi:nucleotidyltransferase family protein [Ureibacillus sinduriensis]|uniref:Alcohol dehydrogenase n=1 Tax=Ureibacillus sinduriensis BLB-1 = JCM 15800 TaxID=1384057 RepID=A0A0A3I1F3_9BACL|nr:nucleotidyltransferase family protein [Ureibacillus sinduriensis]KGR76488.1 alcohol dehydrogenase [Ureibacillus sinduriensis BLB-1 = JCM 15800]
MKSWRSIVVPPNKTLIEVMEIIDKSSLQFAVVTNEAGKLLGTVTDGDIRRALLKGKELQIAIKEVMNSNPIVAKLNHSCNSFYNFMRKKGLKQLPIVDEQFILQDILFKDYKEEKENLVILMVGGLGTRLRPLTDQIPKPMLRVGGKPILETIVDGFKQYGYTNFIFSVNYKKEVIQNYFQNGEAFGVSITYVEETKRMGTAGALSLLPEKPTKPIFVMNGDLLTQVNFEQLMQFHEEHQSFGTMCVREYQYQIPYGVIKTIGSDLLEIQEKPVNKSYVNAGIYVLDPETLSCIPKDEFYDMPSLFERLIKEQKTATVFPIREYWLDIGQLDDFEKADVEYENIFRGY